MLENNKFYTCKYDRPFKEIMLKEQNKDILKILLEQVLKLKINKIDIKNIERNTGNIHIRRKYLDALLYTDQGKIGIEVNAENKNYVKPRNMAFICDMYASHTLVGETYTEDTKIIQINFSYGLNDKKDIRIYKIQDKENKEFVKNFLIYEINMEYYLKLWYNKNEQEVNKYKYFIMLNLEKEDLKQISKKDKVVTKYMEELVKLNSNPEFREYMSVEEDERKKQNTLLQSSYNQGLEQGIEQGIEKGSALEKSTIAKNFLKENIDIKIISKATGLSIEDINEIESNPEFREYMSVEEDERKKQNTLLQSSYNQGLEQGIEQEKIEISKKLLIKGIDEKTISELTNLSIEKIIELTNMKQEN